MLSGNRKQRQAINRYRANQGISYLYVLGTVAVVGLLSIVITSLSLNEFVDSVNLRDRLETMQLAEAGLAQALYELNEGTEEFNGIDKTDLGGGFFSVKTIKQEGELELVATGSVPHQNPRYTYTIRAKLLRTAQGYRVIAKKY